jgi:hypothetical protein
VRRLLLLRRHADYVCLLPLLAAAALWSSPLPTDLDAMNFVLGVRDYDVVNHQPHPPGAPVYIALGKTVTGALKAAGVQPVSPIPIEAVALALCSVLAAMVLLVAWRGVVARVYPEAATPAFLLAAVAPLLWVLALMPLSDVVGLAAALTSQWLALRAEARGWFIAGFAAGLTTGVRVQTALLTVPLLAWRTVQRRERVLPALLGVAGGVMTWLVPLLWVVGPSQYVSAFARQTGEDFDNPYMLLATPSARGAIDAVINAAVLPWGSIPNAIAMLALIGIGALLLWRRQRGALLVAAASIGPYLVFHVLLQETVTVRYALPIVIWGTFVAASGVPLVRARPARRFILTAAVVISAATGFVALRAYSVEQGSMMRIVSALGKTPDARVVVHYGLSIPFDRAASIVDARLKARRLNSAREYEWRAAADYWSAGGQGPIWFIADPRRTDLLLVDAGARRQDAVLDWHPPLDWLLSGTRPAAIRVAEFEPPQWVAIRGFALSSEIGGISRRDGHGPFTEDGAVALVRVMGDEAWLTVGGRHVGDPGDPAVRIQAWVDGRQVLGGDASADKRRFLLRGRIATATVPRDKYVPLVIRSVPVGGGKRVPVAIEQFDFGSPDRTSVSFGDGWHEPELDTGTGRTWRWAAGRAEVLVSSRRERSRLVLRAAAPRAIREQNVTVRIRAGAKVLDEFKAGRNIRRVVSLAERPLDPADEVFTIECSSEFVPAERGDSPDRRRLCLQVFEFSVEPAARRAPAAYGGN